MRSPRPRVPATPSDGNDNHGRRQPFRPLQPLRTPRSPLTPTPPAKPTPPCEVILTPRATPKPVKRKAASRLKRPATKVKKEPPDIDISKVRPPSPSDDPLLLSGARRVSRSPPLRARFTPAFSSSPPGSATCIDPPVSFAARLSGKRVGDILGNSPNTHVDALPVFDAPRVGETTEVWSDSDDDDGFNLTGEYTGKYKILKVPTKADPPTSGTRERMESWGRPVSPFPYSEIMERSFLSSDCAESTPGHDAIPDSTIPREDVDMWEIATEPPLSDVESSPPPSVSEDEFADLDGDLPVFDVEADAESTQVLPLPEHLEGPSGSDPTVLEEQEEEAQIDRELSVDVENVPNVTLTLSTAKRPIVAMEGDSSDEEDDVEGEDIIKISSGDPKAAARAAAILRMHDYDCILAAEKRRRSGRSTRSTRIRRKTVENAGISKSYTDLRNQRWGTLQGSNTSPGSRSLPLLELWRDAEDSVFFEHHSMSYCDASFTLPPLKAMLTLPEPVCAPLGGEWTRDCWKCMDKCLVAERLAVAAACNHGTDVFADTDDVSKDAVLDRFVNQLGGESALAGLGPEWSRANLMVRLEVLIKKQARRVARAPITKARQGSHCPELGYRGLLEEAVALSGETMMERCPTFESMSSDSTVVSDARDAWKTTKMADLSPRPEPRSWETSRSRSPIRTPSRTPELMPPHPKDQVHLRHASLPPMKSMIPVRIRPKRLVDLRHLSPTKPDGGKGRPARRSSGGGSVRDLVRQFESWDR